MSDLPAPLAPANCDLRGYDFMPLHGQRLFGSKFYSLARRNPRAGLAGLKLWWEAWMQCPAASLPDDDFDLAHLAGFGEDLKTWRQVKDVALHGFVRCSDGRLYHPLLAEEAISAFERRLQSDRKREADRARLAAWRASRRSEKEQATEYVSETQTGNTDETQPDTRDATPDDTGCETPMKRVSSRIDRTVTGQDSSVRENIHTDSPTSRASPAPRVGDPPARWLHLADQREVDPGGVTHPVVGGFYLDVVAEHVLREARINPATFRGDWKPLIGWLRDGFDSETILGAVRHVASRPGYPGRIASLQFFDAAVRSQRVAA